MRLVYQTVLTFVLWRRSYQAIGWRVNGLCRIDYWGRVDKWRDRRSNRRHDLIVQVNVTEALQHLKAASIECA